MLAMPVHSLAALSSADLPPLLQFQDGSEVRSPADWGDRREELHQLMTEYFTGSLPKDTPRILKSEILDENMVDMTNRRRVRLTFDTPNQLSFEIRVWIPAVSKTSGSQTRPLLLTQPRYYQIPWAEMALERGYVVCLYPGVDSHHEEEDFPGYDSVWKSVRAEYPEATWTEIATKAWIGSRSLDYLLDPQQDYRINTNHVGIIGFSRYGKQSMIAAAFDPRIKSVVARSPGSPASSPYRFTSRNTFAEAPEDFPGLWFLPDLRSYTGREHELPIDAHGWLGLIAPRRCLIHTAYNDGSEPTFAVERAYIEGRKVYRLLGAANNLRVLYRSGQHGPITQEQRIQNLDWLDLSFGRGKVTQDQFQDQFQEQLVHHFDWPKWRQRQPSEDVLPPSALTGSSAREESIATVRWLLGATPKKIEVASKEPFLTSAESEMMTHDRWKMPNTSRLPFVFGEGVRGNLYFDPLLNKPAPVVIWLHPYSYHSGYNEGYGVQNTTVYHRLAAEGYAVLSYDQCGFGLRLLEGRDFYDTHPGWSRFGRMVHDVSAAVSLITDGAGKFDGTPPAFDRNKIYVVGYSLGGMVGLHATALDQRITGIASFSGFTPFRTDTDEKSTGGIRRFWQWHALLPKLGLFQRNERAIPYDYQDLLKLIAPRPTLVVSPRNDRDATFSDVLTSIALTRQQLANSNTSDHLTHKTPDGGNQFQADDHRVLIDWLRSQE